MLRKLIDSWTRAPSEQKRFIAASNGNEWTATHWTMPIGPHILTHLEDALTECFEYHAQLDSFVMRSGLPRDRLSVARKRAESRKGRWSVAPKRFVVQEILEEIGTGTPDDDRLMSQFIDGVCRGNFSVARPQGVQAINALKMERENDSRASKERRVERQREAEDLQRERDKLGAAKRAARENFRQSFFSLSSLANAQQRGFALECFLDEFIAFEGLSPRGSFKIVGEQIDGSFAWSSRTHLVEAKWVKEPVAGAEFGAFLYKVQGKTADTRGLLISINGYSPQAITSLNSKGELRFVCIDGTHLLRATEAGWNIPRLLDIVWRHAGETGEAYLPVSSPRFIAQG